MVIGPVNSIARVPKPRKDVAVLVQSVVNFGDHDLNIRVLRGDPLYPLGTGEDIDHRYLIYPRFD